MAWRWLVAEEQSNEADEIPQSSDEKQVSPGTCTNDQDAVQELWHERHDAEGDQRECDTSPSCWGDLGDTERRSSKGLPKSVSRFTHPAKATSSQIPAPIPPIACAATACLRLCEVAWMALATMSKTDPKRHSDLLPKRSVT